MRTRPQGDDRGEIGLIGAIIALAIGAALAAATIDVAAPANSGPPPVYLRINHATASRTSDDGVQFEVSYIAGVGAESASPSPWTAESRIYCLAVERGGSARTTSVGVSVFIFPGHSREGTVRLPSASFSSTTTTAAVSCEISREGRYFQSDSTEVAVPSSILPSPGGGPSPGNTSPPSTSPSSGVDVINYIGTYHVTFTRTAGDDLTCGPSSAGALIDVSYAGNTRIKVVISSLNGLGSTSFETELAPTAQFSGELPSYGLLTGMFQNRNGQMYLNGRATSPDGRCTWSVLGPR